MNVMRLTNLELRPLRHPQFQQKVKKKTSQKSYFPLQSTHSQISITITVNRQYNCAKTHIIHQTHLELYRFVEKNAKQILNDAELPSLESNFNISGAHFYSGQHPKYNYRQKKFKLSSYAK